MYFANTERNVAHKLGKGGGKGQGTQAAESKKPWRRGESVFLFLSHSF